MADATVAGPGGLAPWLEARLGAAPVDQFFEAESMSRVRGLTLADGRRIAVKVREDVPHVHASIAAHRAARAAGIDCAEPLAGPEPAPGEPGMAVTVEEWRPDGGWFPADDAAVAYARLLAALVEALCALDPAEFSPPPWLAYDHGTDRIWPPASSPRWDPHRIEADLPPELMRIASGARARLNRAALPSVLGHTDLNALNVRWNGTVPIVHDWDSVAARPEAVLVGTLALDHVSVPDEGRAADIPGGWRVIEAYQVARGRAFTGEEIEVAWAASAWLACYNAVFEFLHGGGARVAERILEDGEHRLALAGA